jgi:hypothetical protein
MRILSKLTFVALAAFILGSCQKDVSYTGTPDPQPVLPDPITATLQGNVLDETGAAASGVTVTVGNRSVTTDNRGYFRITGANLDKNMALVTAQKSGYFKAFRSFAATSGANQVQIKLLKRNLTGTVSAAAGGDATLSNGSKVALPANGIVTASSGASYTGSVKVYAAYIDPTLQDIGQTVPGSLMANTSNGERVVLNSYGMLAVELEGDNGEKLQLKSGNPATLTTAIPASAQASAPATIPMWYLDESTGIWKQEGSATKQGDKYVGTVAHFSFWNCDVSATSVMFETTIKTSNGNPLPHVWVRLTRTSGNYWTSAFGWTDSLGVVRGLVPGNEPLILDVLDICGTPVYTQTVGPFAQNTTLPAITASLPSSQLTTVTGTVVDCSNAGVTNGFAIVAIGNLVHYVSLSATGTFNVPILSCSGTSATVDVLGVNNATQVQSQLTSVPFTAGTTNVGSIAACGISATEFLNYSVDGTAYNLNTSNPGDSVYLYTRQTQGATTWTTTLYGYHTGSSSISVNFVGANSTGTYAATSFSVNNSQPANYNVSVTVSAWAANIGDFMQGTISGTYSDSSGSHTVSGTFKLRRNF